MVANNSNVPEIGVESAVATVEQFKEKAAESKNLKLRPLTEEEMTKARQWAVTLIPADLDNIPSYVNLASAERAVLTKAARRVLEKVSVEEMKKVKSISQQILGKIESIDINDLSPQAKEKFLGIKETVQAIIKRIDAFFDRYKTVQGEIDNLSVEVVKMRDFHITIKNDFDQVAKETRDSRNIIRIAVEACKIFLNETGYPEKKDLIAKVDADKAEADKEGRLTDEKLVENLRDYNSYLEMVEKFMNTMEGAIVDAHQTYEALEMLENNERIVAQTLNDVLEFTLPSWQRMIVAAWGAYQAKNAVDFVQEMNDKTATLRKQTADMLGESADAVAALEKEDTFDIASMEYMNNKLITAIKTLASAADEASAIHEASREAGYRMIDVLSATIADTARQSRQS